MEIFYQRGRLEQMPQHLLFVLREIRSGVSENLVLVETPFFFEQRLTRVSDLLIRLLNFISWFHFFKVRVDEVFPLFLISLTIRDLC